MSGSYSPWARLEGEIIFGVDGIELALGERGKAEESLDFLRLFRLFSKFLHSHEYIPGGNSP